MFEEANRDQGWRMAIEEEMAALRENHTWTLGPLPVNQHLVGCRWVYTIKHKSDGSVDRFKARLVAKGYSQVPGVDFH